MTRSSKKINALEVQCDGMQAFLINRHFRFSLWIIQIFQMVYNRRENDLMVCQLNQARNIF